MKLSREARRQARELFELALVEGRLDAARLRLIADGVADSKPRQYLQILKEITRLVRLETAKHHAVVETAQALSPAEAQEFQKNLHTRFGDVSVEFHQNPALIGGARVQVGSDVWDGSIQARLETIKQQL